MLLRMITKGMATVSQDKHPRSVNQEAIFLVIQDRVDFCSLRQTSVYNYVEEVFKYLSEEMGAAPENIFLFETFFSRSCSAYSLIHT